MSKPWGGLKAGAGAWAAEAEREEAEERAAAEAAAAGAGSFPSLKEANNAKPGKKKKIMMSLSEFQTGGAGTGGARGSAGGALKGLTPDEMMRLPTGPKERSEEEIQAGRFGGGFSTYGRSGMGSGRGREREEGGDGSWGGGGRRSYGGFGEERSARVSDLDQMPSRADEADNWSREKKSLPSFDSSRQSRFGGGGGGGMDFGSGSGGASRADEVDNWSREKKPSAPAPARSSTFGSGGFRDSDSSDRWSRGSGGGGGFRESSDRERPRLVLAPPKADPSRTDEGAVKSTKPNPFGAARPREDVLAEKGLDWKKMDSDIDAKKTTSRPSSAHSSRPSSAHSTRSESGPGLHGIENVVKPRPKVNPFGDAKPREILLEEKGMDWRKIDLDLEKRRGAERVESAEEKALKEEIDNLKKQLEEPSQEGLQDRILTLEQELEKLSREMDEKVRLAPKPLDRPGSGAGRSSGYHDRPPSQSGSVEESRNTEFLDRPRSRGAGDAWARPADDRRVFQGSRDRGFLGSRDLNRRSRSRERW